MIDGWMDGWWLIDGWIVSMLWEWSHVHNCSHSNRTNSENPQGFIVLAVLWNLFLLVGITVASSDHRPSPACNVSTELLIVCWLCLNPEVVSDTGTVHLTSFGHDVFWWRAADFQERWTLMPFQEYAIKQPHLHLLCCGRVNAFHNTEFSLKIYFLPNQSEKQWGSLWKPS